MIRNPILPGFNPDPSICRRGDEYFIAVSTFEWFPGIAVYKSLDLEHWKLHTHALTDERFHDLRRLEPSKGIWAPCLTWCEDDGLFYLAYTIMQSMTSRFFDLDNYVITAPEIEGPWSDPVYLNSSGFDPSLFHDDDGRKWLVNLEWESREDYEHPGIIVLQEYSAEKKCLLGSPRRIWRGGTDRGCIEGPHLYKRNGLYYLMCAEGGTGYGHCVTMARSESVTGGYEGDPGNPILTSTRNDFYSRHDEEFLKSFAYNPDAELQKAGHGSWVETPGGEHYLAYLCARPILPELRCMLGRETAIQKARWTDDGWLRLYSESRLPNVSVPSPDLPSHEWEPEPARDEFNRGWSPHYNTPRISPRGWARINEEDNTLVLRGQESLSSHNRVSLVARRVTDFRMEASTCLEFEPESFQESAGLCFYYNNLNYLYLRLYHSESLGGTALGITSVRRGDRDEIKSAGVRVDSPSVFLKVELDGRKLQFLYSLDSEEWTSIGGAMDASQLSDECCGGEGFTGVFVGMCCIDSRARKKKARFRYFEYLDLGDR